MGRIFTFLSNSAVYKGCNIILYRRYGPDSELHLEHLQDTTSHIECGTKSKTSDYDATVISLRADAVGGIQSFGYKILQAKDSKTPLCYTSLIASLLNEQKLTESVVLAVRSFIFYLMELKQKETIVEKSIDRRTEIFNAFVVLLNENGIRHHLSGFYADKINISLNHLNDIIKEKSGRTVYQWITEYLTIEAKAMLLHTTNTVQQVSDSLNFPNSAFFCKFFKTHTGLTPTQFRICR